MKPVLIVAGLLLAEFSCCSVVAQVVDSVKPVRENVARQDTDYEKIIGSWSVVEFRNSKERFVLPRPEPAVKVPFVMYKNFNPRNSAVFTFLAVDQRIFVTGAIHSLTHATNSAQVYNITSGKTTKQIDIESLMIEYLGCPESKGIYRFEGDELVCVFSVAGQPRPEDFELEGEENQFLLRLRKVGN